MAKLEYSEIKPRKVIIYKDEPCEVVEYYVARTNQRKPQNQCKLRNLINGRVIPATFHASETVDEADVSRKEAKFIYSSKGEFWFADPKNPSDRYVIAQDIIGDSAKFLKEGTIVDIRIWTDDEDEEKIIGMTLPIKVTLKVKEAPPAIKGNTASGGDKLVELETGAKITVPLFIEVGDDLIINTDTGEYVERAK